MKRGSTGLSFVVGIDKPEGITSHDVVNRVRRIYGEKRVGHTGTLDPMASGAMAVCVGPATKLSNYLTAHRKAYLARIVFGLATDTDDAEGAPLEELHVPETVRDAEAATAALDAVLGPQEQMPPAYSAIKVGGVKSYEAARKGNSVDLKPRPIEVFAADLLAMGQDESGRPFWDVAFDVSAGTYVRSLARDLGQALGSCAHLGSLRRVRSGELSLAGCVALEELEAAPDTGRLDPVALLGFRWIEASGERQRNAVANGGKIGIRDLVVFEFGSAGGETRVSALQPGEQPDGQSAGKPAEPQGVPSSRPLGPGETICVLMDNKLAALYAYDEQLRCLKACCGFAQGVSRGTV